VIANEKPDGQGRKLFHDGTIYEGNFSNGLFEGYGKLVKPNGFKFEGHFKANLPHGSGVETWPDKSYYNG